jgi:hypothetical protein
VNVTIEEEGQSFAVNIHPQELEKGPVHIVSRAYSVDLPGHWHPQVISGLGKVCQYQEGDVIRLFPATTESLRSVTEPRTQKGSVAAIPNAIGGGKPAERQKKPQEEQCDWIAELKAPGEVQIQDPGQFTAQFQMDKMVTMTTDGGERPNPSSAGWGVLTRQNGKLVCLWKHYDKASNNAMEISAVIAGLTFLPQGMTVWLSTDSQYVQRGISSGRQNCAHCI